MKILRLVAAAIVGAFIAGFVSAGPVSIDHQAIPLNRAELVVSGPQGDKSYTPADLETLGFRRLTTVTPWRDQPAAFDGVLLADLLAANGLQDVPAINVIAENDYAVVIPADVWKRWPVLIATRVNGKAHTRRQRGPIQFILPMSDDATSGALNYQQNWVWMAARIEAAF